MIRKIIFSRKIFSNFVDERERESSFRKEQQLEERERDLPRLFLFLSYLGWNRKNEGAKLQRHCRLEKEYNAKGVRGIEGKAVQWKFNNVEEVRGCRVILRGCNGPRWKTKNIMSLRTPVKIMVTTGTCADSLN